MDIHASPTTLPALDEFLSTLKVRFRRLEGEVALDPTLTAARTFEPVSQDRPS
jgi:hypothetical protein